jgi:uncharacterized protein with FMN-binding domain
MELELKMRDGWQNTSNPPPPTHLAVSVNIHKERINESKVLTETERDTN